jgi:DNA-binding beta-propeller fold protein YncE
VLRVDPDTNQVTQRVEVGRAPAGLAAGPGGLWVSLHVDGQLARVDPGQGRVVERVDVDGYPDEVAAAGNELWVATDAG